MASNERLLSLVIVFVGILLATVGPTVVDSDTAALACVVGGIVFAFAIPVFVVGPQTLWWETDDRRTRAVQFRASVVGWYVTIAALLAVGLSIEYLPAQLSMEAVVWGLIAVGLAARIGSKLYFERSVGDGDPTAT